MRKLLFISLIFFCTTTVIGQKIVSGEYSDALRLAFDGVNSKVTGYFEEYNGYDEITHNSKFSCIFYLQGSPNSNKFSIKTFYPKDSAGDVINGTLEIINNKTVKIKLEQEHGGCWNVDPGAGKPEKFELYKSFNWIQIRYTTKDKVFFYSSFSNDSKLKSYLVKGDIVFIEKIQNQWALCNYFGKKITKGWIKLDDLNHL